MCPSPGRASQRLSLRQAEAWTDMLDPCSHPPSQPVLNPPALIKLFPFFPFDKKGPSILSLPTSEYPGVKYTNVAYIYTHTPRHQLRRRATFFFRSSRQAASDSPFEFLLPCPFSSLLPARQHAKKRKILQSGNSCLTCLSNGRRGLARGRGTP